MYIDNKHTAFISVFTEIKAVCKLCRTNRLIIQINRYSGHKTKNIHVIKNVCVSYISHLLYRALHGDKFYLKHT